MVGMIQNGYRGKLREVKVHAVRIGLTRKLEIKDESGRIIHILHLNHKDIDQMRHILK